jgi:hypothetical protein
VTDKRDENVYQHLLRVLRDHVASTLGLNLKAKDTSGPAILHATVIQANLDLDIIIDELDRREDGRTPLNYSLRSIRDRLSLGLMLSEGLFDPDKPFMTASAIEYYPGGFAAYEAERNARKGGAP